MGICISCISSADTIIRLRKVLRKRLNFSGYYFTTRLIDDGLP